MKTKKCAFCDSIFLARSWNSLVCSNKCRKARQKIEKQKWYLNNKETENKKSYNRMKQYTKQEIREQQRRYRCRNGFKVLGDSCCIVCNHIYKKKVYNSKTCSSKCSTTLKKRNNAEYIANRLNHDITFKLAHQLRTRINKIIKGRNKVGSAIKDLGCSVKEFKKHLESKFQGGMSWNNYGEWHIDHIKPLSSFDLENKEEFKKACHYTNLQPLWAKDNLRKGSQV